MSSNNTAHQQQQQQQQSPRQDRFSSAVNSVSKGLLLGTAFGDAFGIPIECKTFNELQLLRKCWIDQVLHEHPELVPFREKFASRNASVSPGQDDNDDNIIPTGSNLAAAAFARGGRANNQSYNNNSVASETCDEDDSGQNRHDNKNNNNNTLLSRQDTAPNMDQKTTSDDAGNKAVTNAMLLGARTSSFSGGGGSSTLDEIPTPKNQPLSLSQHSENNNNSNNDNVYLNEALLLVPPRDRLKLAPLAFAATIGHPFIAEEDNFMAGGFTDDTQLACAIARAIAHSLVPDGENKNNNNNNNSSANVRQQQQQRRAMRRTRLSDEENGDDDDDAANNEIDFDDDINNNSTTSNPNGSKKNKKKNSLLGKNENNDEDDEAATSGYLDSANILSKKNTGNSNNKCTVSPTSGPKPPPTSAVTSNNNNNVTSQSNNITNQNSSSSPTSLLQQQQQQQTNANNGNNNDIIFQYRSLRDGDLVCKNPEGLIANRLQFYHLAQEHVIEHQRSLVGWGGTKVAVARLIRPVEETREALSRADAQITQKAILQRFNAHLTSGNEKATGNGVLMKLTPLSLVLGLEQALVRRAQAVLSREDKKTQQRNRIGAKEKLIVELTRMTHGSGDAVATALVHNEMLCSLFEDFFISCVFTKSIDSPKHNHKDDGGVVASPKVVVANNNNNNNKQVSFSSNKNTMTNNQKQQQQQPSSEQVHEDDAPTSSNNTSNNGMLCDDDDHDDDDEQQQQQQQQQEATRQTHNPGSPLFDRVQSSSKRAALVAALFQVAIDRGISFCEELSVGDVVPGDLTSSVIIGGGVTQNNSINNNNNMEDSAHEMSSNNIAAAAVSSSNNATSHPSAKTTLIDLNFPESFAKIATSLKKVKVFFADLIRRHHDLAEEAWLQGDVFPFISKHEREEIEKKIVEISDGGTFYCIDSLIFVWSYCACFGPCCAVNCARPDIVPIAIAHSALLGGDTDSNAAMIGGIFGAIFGERSIAPHVNNLQHTEVLDEATKCLECSLNALLSGKLA